MPSFQSDKKPSAEQVQRELRRPSPPRDAPRVRRTPREGVREVGPDPAAGGGQRAAEELEGEGGEEQVEQDQRRRRQGLSAARVLARVVPVQRGRVLTC